MQIVQGIVVRVTWWMSCTAALFLTAVNLYAYRVEFVATRDGERLHGSEICLHRGSDGRGPAAVFFASGDVRCLPADDIIDLPSGQWSFYARHEDGYVSAHGSTITHSGPRNADKGYRVVPVDLHPASYITFKKVATTPDRFAAYVPMLESKQYAPAVFPVPETETRIAVPAGKAFALLRIRNGKPIAAGPLMKLDPGLTLDAVEAVPAADARDLIGWIRIDDPSLYEAENVRPPVARLYDASGKERLPLFDWDSAGAANDGLVIFRNVPSGGARLRLTGPDWQTKDIVVQAQAEGAPGRFIDEPLVARLPQRITIRWQAPTDALEPKSCDDRATRMSPTEWSVALLACATGRNISTEATGCRELDRQAVVDSNNGIVAFDVRSPGTYHTVLERAGTRLGVASVTVSAGKDSDALLAVQLPSVFGLVTEGDRPLRALIRFETGSAVSDESGSYVALLTADPLDNIVDIVPCDGSDVFQHIPTERIVGTRQYDIHVPGNRVEVSVRDAVTTKPIANASIGRGLFESADDARAATPLDDVKTDEQGSAVLRRLQPGYFARICATATGYSPAACAEPIRLEQDTVSRVTLSLRPKAPRQGRVVTDARLRATTIYRVTSAGTIVEVTQANEDGSFSYTGDGAADGIVIAGMDHPLAVVPHPPITDNAILEVRFPAGRVRDFTVRITENMPQRSGWFTIAVGNAVVPLNALASHLTRRGLTSYVEDGGPARVVQILESAPLRVVAILGRYPEPSSPSDLFVFPQYAAIREFRPVPPDGNVVFDPER
ncbi:MAG TPA: hypothetical protein VEK11_21425 [Thermoanaerobaculia bacterium]|nr:hypothetical protein [Thermoanaerobaculia bacterium]